MTTPDIAGLCERLRAFHAGGYRKEAADTLERQAAELANCRQHWSSEFKKLSAESKALAEEQAAEIERLRGALGEILKIAGGDIISVRVKKRAQAALTGEDHA